VRKPHLDLTNVPNAVLNILNPYLSQGAGVLAGDTSRMDYADLEIGLHRRNGSGYSVETRFTPPGSASEIRLGANAPVEIELNEGTLAKYLGNYDWTGYGRALSAALFAPEPLKMAFGQALARSAASSLRLRLLFGPTAQDLHSLLWETLRNPLDDTLLAANQNILFSRYLAGNGSKEVHPRPRSAVRALVAVSNPSDLEDYGLDSVDVESELERARDSLRGIRISSLPSETEVCTLAGLVRRLQEGYDILYLAAHGSLAKDQAWLWLQDERGQAQRVSGVELAEQVRLLDKPPLLVVLASCESAGNATGNALQALGPQISEAGVPAVIAMQGKITMQSVARAMPVFFERLLRDGLVDRAMAAARATLSAAGAQDLWMPALFMRLKDGSLWQPSGETAPAPVKQLWDLILARFQGRLAAEGAVQDLSSDAEDPDNREAFIIQLKKAMRENPEFAEELLATIREIQKNGKSGGPGGVLINVGGNVGGSIVLGNNNTIGNISKAG
jgi:hypothetical protein